MRSIFISYREADSAGWAAVVCTALVRRFGADEVFLDKDALAAGNWRKQLERALDDCKVVLVLIGSRWLTVADERGEPRILRPDDVHRQEIALALTKPHVTVIPVLVDGAAMPRAQDVPEDLRSLCDQQAREVGKTTVRQNVDFAVLFTDIEQATGLLPETLTPAAAPDAPAGTAAEDTAMSAPAERGRRHPLRPGFGGIVLAVALTFIVAVAFRVAGITEMDSAQIGFVFLVFVFLVILVNWLRS